MRRNQPNNFSNMSEKSSIMGDYGGTHGNQQKTATQQQPFFNNRNPSNGVIIGGSSNNGNILVSNQKNRTSVRKTTETEQEPLSNTQSQQSQQSSSHQRNRNFKNQTQVMPDLNQNQIVAVGPNSSAKRSQSRQGGKRIVITQKQEVNPNLNGGMAAL